MITKDFITAKDLCTYSIIILRQEKSLRDHGAGWRRPCDTGRFARLLWLGRGRLRVVGVGDLHEVQRLVEIADVLPPLRWVEAR
jgi:hypothetical protein